MVRVAAFSWNGWQLSLVYALSMHRHQPPVSTFLPPFAKHGFALHTFRQQTVTSTTMRALTPDCCHFNIQVSQLTAPYLLIVPPPTTPSNPIIALTTTTARLMIFRLRHLAEGSSLQDAESSSLPADRYFMSSCFSPCLTTTQLLSITELWFTPTRTCTVLIRRHHWRTTNQPR